MSDSDSLRISELKRELISTAAACDRGFGAGAADRARVGSLLSALVTLNPPKNPTRGLFPYNYPDESEASLAGCWRMIYTDAYDVLSLAASPLTLLQGIYQVIDSSGKSANVIDITSRLTPLIPVRFAEKLESVLRLKVLTQSKARSETRVGLRFQSVKVQPLTFLGQSLPASLPALQASLPQKFLYDAIDAFSNKSDDIDSSIGFFDVAYLDSDMLVIKQNQPGGIFISTRDASADPITFF